MFHLLLGLMALGMFAVVIAIALIPMWLGPLVQAAIAALSRGKIARWIPGALGVLGLAASLYYFCIAEQVFPPWGVLLYWTVYGLFLWAADAVVNRIREWLRQRRGQ